MSEAFYNFEDPVVGRGTKARRKTPHQEMSEPSDENMTEEKTEIGPTLGPSALKSTRSSKVANQGNVPRTEPFQGRHYYQIKGTNKSDDCGNSNSEDPIEPEPEELDRVWVSNLDVAVTKEELEALFLTNLVKVGASGQKEETVREKQVQVGLQEVRFVVD
eukprot:Filipodium_phascolosomae@DN4675_c0_g1_i1.p1